MMSPLISTLSSLASAIYMEEKLILHFIFSQLQALPVPPGADPKAHGVIDLRLRKCDRETACMYMYMQLYIYTMHQCSP